MNTLKQWAKLFTEKASGVTEWLVEPLEFEASLGQELRHRQAAASLARRAYAARLVN
jgi:hypothetical protein